MIDNKETPHLLVSLIKMVGRANQNVESLQQRVSQLEWLIRERQSEQSRPKIPAQNS